MSLVREILHHLLAKEGLALVVEWVLKPGFDLVVRGGAKCSEHVRAEEGLIILQEVSHLVVLFTPEVSWRHLAIIILQMLEA